MPALREIQRAFAASVLRREPVAAALEPRPSDARLARRLGVYRANARENFAAALDAAYPVMRRQLGEEGFRSLAWSYQQRHPSPSGSLFESGRALPAFLGGRLDGTCDEYLGDLARLEWAVQESMVAADLDARLDLRRLAEVPPARHATLRFALHPSVRTVATRFALFELWRDSQAAGCRDTPGPAPARDAERMLVRRTVSGIEVRLLDETVHRCLACVSGGGSLGDMAEIALSGPAGTDIGAILAGWARDGVVTGFNDEGNQS